MSRFVVLEHDHPRGRHWDFMLEEGDVLKTWALTAPPNARHVAAEALPDHRLAYLDYEGPISGDRGHVRRWDQGEYYQETHEADRWVVILAGRRLSGQIVLSRRAEEPDIWDYQREP